MSESGDAAEEGLKPSPLSLKADLNVATRYVSKNTSRDKRGFVIGLATVLVLVTFVCLLENSIKKTPVIFMRLAENSVGEYDLVLTPLPYDKTYESSFFTACPRGEWINDPERPWNDGEELDISMLNNISSQDVLRATGLQQILDAMFLNWSKYDHLLSKCDKVNHSVPRWMMLANVRPTEFKASAKESNASVVMVIANHSLERKIGLGREFDVEKIGDREAAVSRTLLSRLGMKTNDEFFISIDFLSLMTGINLGEEGQHGRSLFEMFIASTGLPREINVTFELPETTVLNDTYITLNFTSLAENAELLQALADQYNFQGEIPDPDMLIFLLKLMLGVPLSETVAEVPLSQLLPGILTIIGVDDPNPKANIYMDFFEQFGPYFDEIGNVLVFNQTFKVIASVDEPGGKYPDTLGNAVVVDAVALEPYVKQFIASLGKPVQNLVNNVTGTLDNIISVLSVVASASPQLQNLLQTLTFTKAMLSSLNITTEGIAEDFKMAEYAMTAVAQLKEREEAYLLGVDELKEYMRDMSDLLSDYIGFNESVAFSTPVADSIGTYEFFRLFIDQIFLFILIVMLFLGACLVFSLLLSDVESKTYEYGMLRALGMKQYVLAELLSIQSLMFSVPGIVGGIFLGWIFFIPISYYISTYTMLEPDLGLNVVAWVLALCMGFFMPIVANIVPIKRALSNTLRDALDIYHKVVQSVSVTVKRLQDVGINATVLLVSFLLVALGLICYFLIPVSFVEADMELFFTIFILILILFLFGLSMIGTVLQPFLQKLLLYAIVWGHGRSATRSLVRKNLSGHHTRNSKTALMLTTSLAFIIFAGSVFNLLGSSLKDFSRLALASDLAVISGGIKAPLEEDNLRRMLDAELKHKDCRIEAFTFLSFPLSAYDFVRVTQLANLGNYPPRSVSVQGIEQNFLDATFSDFYRTSEIVDQDFDYVETKEGDPDVIDSLYRHAGKQVLPLEEDIHELPKPPLSEYYSSPDYNEIVKEKYTSYIDVLISEALRDGASIDTDTPLMLRLVYFKLNSTDTVSLFFMCKARAMLESLQGFTFSKYKSMEYGSPMIVNMEAFQTLLKLALKESDMPGVTIPDVPAKQRLLIKLKDDISTEEREQLVNELHVYVNNDLIYVQDTADLMETMDTTLSMLNIFFLVVSIIAGLLCFFVLWLSFTANVNENSWEFAVLRSVGITAGRVISLYVFEALAIVLSSVIIGTIIGLVVAIMMTGQFGMFTQLPFKFVFPSELFFPILAMCIVIALIGSYIPASVIRRKPISSVLKGM